ncbi:MAG: hypothetical protein ACI4PC_04985 [Oscillospiraceae bacterium]
MKKLDFGAAAKTIAKNKYVLLVLALGLLLLLLPNGSGGGSAAVQTETKGVGDDLAASGIPVDTESRRIAALLSQIEGVGESQVLLSAEGAVVVCQGCDSAKVRLDVTNAVMAYTGLGSDKISILKMK